MKRILLLLIGFNFFANTISAQNLDKKIISKTLSREEILKNPDVLWVGEFYSIFLLDEFDENKTENPKYLDSMGIKKNRRIKVAPIKNIATRQREMAGITDFYFRELITYETIDKTAVYANDSCTRLLSKEEISLLFRWETGREPYSPEDDIDKEYEVYYENLNVGEINAYKVKHLVYYNQKSNSINTLMEAIAPLIDVWGESRREPLFWLKINNMPTLQNLNDTAIIWARSTIRTFHWEEAKVLKSTKNIEQFLTQYIQKITQNSKTEDVRIPFSAAEKMPPSEIEFLKIKIDTIYSAEPTFDGTIQTIASNKFEEKDILSFRFVQEWYWNALENKMMLHTRFFVPIADIYDHNRNYLASSPLFWKPTKLQE